MESIYHLNSALLMVHQQMLDLLHDDSIRCLPMDTVVMIKINKLQTNFQQLSREKNKRIHSAYSYSSKTDLSSSVIASSIAPQRLTVTTIVIGKNSTTLAMVPHWFQPVDQSEALKNIKYPANVTNRRPFNMLAGYRMIKQQSNDFDQQPIEVNESSTETLLLALDDFIHQFGGQLSFTTDDLSFEGSADRTACGVADLGSAHLLTSEHVASATFTLLLDLDYNGLVKSQDTIRQFLMNFTTAVADDLSCDPQYVRVTSVDRSTEAKGKAQINLVLTTPNKGDTEALAELFTEHARRGFSRKTVLKHVHRDAYHCKWMPILSHLQLQPSDFDPRYNRDYSTGGYLEKEERGGEPYYLPLGWYRHGLKVDTKYKDDPVWLGSSNVKGEWPAAFHGTKSRAVKSIADKGLLVGTIERDAMLPKAIQQKGEAVNRPGLYVATHCNGGSHPLYTELFDVQIPPGEQEGFQVVFQCRVKPDSYTRHPEPVCLGEAWRIVDPTAIRPYGILLKDKKTKVPYDSGDN